MNTSPLHALTLSAALLAFCLGSPAIAAPDGQGAAHAAKAGARDHGIDHAQKLRDKLGLTPAQEPALQAFMAGMKPARQAGAAKPDKADRMQERQAATAKFRAQLTPAQQTKFDAMQTKRKEHRHAAGDAKPRH